MGDGFPSSDLYDKGQTVSSGGRVLPLKFKFSLEL